MRRSSAVRATAAMMLAFLAAVSAAAVIPAPYADGAADSAEDGESGPPLVLLPGGEKRAADDGGRLMLGLGKRGGDRYTPYISVGVLSNMQQFFDNLRSNLETIESMPKEEREALLGQAPVVTVHRRIGCGSSCCRCRSTRPPMRTTRKYFEQDREIRPKATAAYLHALRNHRPSYKIRNFVAESETRSSHGRYDPGYLWTGLGRKR
ncbi:uncharacterized protein LOC124606849 isoform X1 [Schistocerca americana]|uniref:uncharacterized protein LOC124606849 isoform X1 n=1 Tax=Schistocerca americana TaxID=7009 RepID=UPI001F4F7F93|nr:uncharacterized protein LOC124606849 isoform X1 [Schistocerca americana]